MRIDDVRTGIDRNRRFTGQQRHERRGRRSKKNRIHIEAVFEKDAALLGHPQRQIVGADRAVPDRQPLMFLRIRDGCRQHYENADQEYPETLHHARLLPSWLFAAWNLILESVVK
jgi:hypothetical protein